MNFSEAKDGVHFIVTLGNSVMQCETCNILIIT